MVAQFATIQLASIIGFCDMGDIVKVGWSGGKDSTASVLLHLERGDKVKACCYVPMFTKNIPLITKNHYEFIMSASDRLRQMGAEVHIVSGMTYFDFVTHRITKGKNKGKIFGFPTTVTGMCEFKNYSKVASLKKLDVGYYDYEDIGIACDEVKRLGQLSESLRSILVEEHFTEQMATRKCFDAQMLSPHYQFEKRDGCALCYNAPKKRREKWFFDYPQAIPLVIELQELVKEKRPDRPPCWDYKIIDHPNEKGGNE